MSPLSSARVAMPCLLAVMAAGCDRQSPPAGQANVADAGAANAPVVASDEVAASGAPAAATTGIDRSHRGEAAPTLTFKGPDGKPTSLAAFRGKPVLVNLWATWCGPCVAELPTLAAAAQAWTGKVAVVAIAQDTQRTAGVPAFLTAHGAATLKPYIDDQAGLSLGYGANLPTTILFDAAGKEVWRWNGGNDWAGAKAKALIGSGLEV